MTKTKEFKCGQCTEGIVKMVIKSSSTKIDLIMKNCNNCKASYGIKKVRELVEIKTITNNNLKTKIK